MGSTSGGVRVVHWTMRHSHQVMDHVLKDPTCVQCLCLHTHPSIGSAAHFASGFCCPIAGGDWCLWVLPVVSIWLRPAVAPA